MHSIDIFVQNYFSLARTSTLTELMYLLSILFDVSFYFVAVAFFTAILIYLVRSFRYSILFISTLVSGGILVYFLKMFFNVSRPTEAVLSAFGQSFPSYHATIATIFFSLLMYIFDDYFSSVSRIAFNTFCIALLFLVAISRVYLGVHWVSDVLVGVLLGAVISYLAVKFSKKLV